jgi:hypothetical protein
MLNVKMYPSFNPFHSCFINVKHCVYIWLRFIHFISEGSRYKEKVYPLYVFLEERVDLSY